MNIFKIATTTLLATGIMLAASACTQQAPQMPIASPSQTTAPKRTEAPSDKLPKDAAVAQTPVLLKTTSLAKGVTVRAYRVGTGEVVPQQLQANPALKAAGVKVGAKLVVVRYTIENTSGKAVDTVSFSYNGVFAGGNGEGALFDNGYASATARLGHVGTPIAQFTDKKGKSGNWSLPSGDKADWYTDWILQEEGDLFQNYVFGKKVLSNIEIDLLKQA